MTGYLDERARRLGCRLGLAILASVVMTLPPRASAQAPAPADPVVAEACAFLGGCAACDGARAACEAEREMCEENLAACGACGNGVLDPGEECDGSELGAATCSGETDGAATSGALACAAGCQIDAAGCRPRFEVTELTVVDHATGLEWERKDSADGVPDPSNLHDADNRLSLCSSPGCTTEDGTAWRELIDHLNDCPSTDGRDIEPGFAGHCDWRLPEYDEIASVLDCAADGACIHPVPGPSPPSSYWSATSFPAKAAYGWAVDFRTRRPFVAERDRRMHVRAVRGPFPRSPR